MECINLERNANKFIHFLTILNVSCKRVRKRVSDLATMKYMWMCFCLEQQQQKNETNTKERQKKITENFTCAESMEWKQCFCDADIHLWIAIAIFLSLFVLFHFSLSSIDDFFLLVFFFFYFCSRCSLYGHVKDSLRLVRNWLHALSCILSSGFNMANDIISNGTVVNEWRAKESERKTENENVKKEKIWKIKYNI